MRYDKEERPVQSARPIIPLEEQVLEKEDDFETIRFVWGEREYANPVELHRKLAELYIDDGWYVDYSKNSVIINHSPKLERSKMCVMISEPQHRPNHIDPWKYEAKIRIHRGTTVQDTRIYLEQIILDLHNCCI